MRGFCVWPLSFAQVRASGSQGGGPRGWVQGEGSAGGPEGPRPQVSPTGQLRVSFPRGQRPRLLRSHTGKVQDFRLTNKISSENPRSQGQAAAQTLLSKNNCFVDDGEDLWISPLLHPLKSLCSVLMGQALPVCCTHTTLDQCAGPATRDNIHRAPDADQIVSCRRRSLSFPRGGSARGRDQCLVHP